MGQQYIESLGMDAKPVKKEWPSELQCYTPEEIKEELLDMVFNKQYGIFFYEPASKEEAEKMVSSFEEKIIDLRRRYKLGNHIFDLSLTDTKTNKEWKIDFIFVAFPGLETMGQRVEGFHQTGTLDGFQEGEFEEFGTLVISDGKLKIIQW
jgi:hypothetical protein